MDADLAIVGAGVMGTALAWNLRNSGLSIVLIDRAEPGAATTTWSYAWMNASSKFRLGYVPEYVALSVDAASDAYQLALEVPGDWLHVSGNLELVPADGSSLLEGDIRRMLRHGYPAQFLDHSQLVRRHPELEIDDGTVAGWYPTEGWIDGPVLVNDIVRCLDGSRIRLVNDEVVGLEIADPPETRHHLDALSSFAPEVGVSGVRLASGTCLAVRGLVVTAGAWTADLAAMAGVTVPMIGRDDSAVPGLIVRATAPDGGLRHPVMSTGFLARPHRSGEVLLAGDGHGCHLTAQSSSEDARRAADRLLALSARTIPALSASRVIKAGVGLRALTQDGVAIVGPSEVVPNMYVAVTHSAVSLAASLGKLIARELLFGSRETVLEPFRLTRFN